MSDNTTVSSTDRLSFTLFVAIAVHALIIFGVALRVNSNAKPSPTLNVTLATHQSDKAPSKADFLAQFNQEASGSENEVKELTTQERTPINDIVAREVSPVEQVQKRDKQSVETQVITTSGEAKRSFNKKEELDPEPVEESIEGEEIDIERTTAEAASLKAKLDKLKQEFAKIPRVRRLTSVSTKMSHDAEYLVAWVEKFEAVGNKHFPKEALQKQIFGSLRFKVTLLPDGNVEDVSITKSSGHALLDAATTQFIYLASPFREFPPEIRKDIDKIEIFRTVKFELAGLSTSSSGIE